jgi:hypothetical protein
MFEQEYGHLSPVQEKRIKNALESTCELCREYYPLSLLEIHAVTGSRSREKRAEKNPEKRMLVVCPLCHRHIHILPVPVSRQKALIEKRQFTVRKEIRRILGYVPKPYTPPDDADLAKIYEELFSPGSLASFRISG